MSGILSSHFTLYLYFIERHLRLNEEAANRMHPLKDELYQRLRTDFTLFDFFQDSGPDGCWYRTLENSQECWANSGLLKLLGYAPSLPGIPEWSQLSDPEETKALDNDLRASSTTKSFTRILHYRHQTGFRLPMQTTLLPVADADGRVVKVLGLVRLLQTGPDALGELYQQNKRLNDILAGSNAGTWEWDVSTDRLTVNTQWKIIAGIETSDTFSGNDWLAYIHPDDRAKSEDIRRKYLSVSAAYECEYRIKSAIDGWIWVIERGRVSQRDANGRSSRVSGTLQDITVRKTAELALITLRNRQEQTNQAARIGTWEIDPVSLSLTWNQVTREIHEVPDEFVPELNSALGFYTDPKSKEAITTAFAKAIETGTPYDLELKITTYTGKEKWVRAIGVAEMSEGRCAWLYGTFQDIHESKMIQVRLRESDERNRIFVEQAPNALAMFDRNMHYIAASQQWLKDYSLKGQSIIGRSHYEIFPEIGESWKKIHQLCMMGAIDKCDEARFVRQNGAVQWIAWEVRPWYIRDGEIGGILMYTADITERKQVQQQLRINEAQLRGAFENSTTGMALVGLRGDWLKVNNSLCKFIGYSAEELLQIRFQDITHPEDLDGDLDLLEELLAGKRDYYRMEKRYIHKQGHTVWALLSVSLIRSAEGQPLHFVSQINDITDEKKLAQLRLAIQDQAYSFIAHELHENFAQTLAATRMFIELSMDGNQDRQTFLQKSLENIETLTQQIQALTQTIAPTTLINEDYFSLIGDLVENYTGQAGMKIRYDFDPDVSSADPATGFHLFRILENQLKSAARRQAQKVSIIISKGQLLHISVSDDGIDHSEHDTELLMLQDDIITRVELVKGKVKKLGRAGDLQILSLDIPC